MTITGATPPRKKRFLGCLLGGAAGDALGAPVEFLRRREILRTFGDHGITEYIEAYGGLGRITDDTQMTLFTAEGLLRGWVRGNLRGITTYTGVTAYAYRRWLHTQGDPIPSQGDPAFGEPGWLIQHPELHHQRAPGNTCLSALRRMRAGEPACNDSKGCGGIMRMAPAGLFGERLGEGVPAEEVFQLGVDLAALTHGHPSGQLSAGAFALIIRELANGSPLADAINLAKICLRTHRDHEETLRGIEQAEDLAGTGSPPADAVRQLGEGWVAEEALSIALYAVLVARDFRDGVTIAVNHDGDSDSTGAITGNLLGTIHGVDAIPTSWIEPLELREVITEIAEDLFNFPDWDLDDSRICEKYPGA